MSSWSESQDILVDNSLEDSSHPNDSNDPDLEAVPRAEYRCVRQASDFNNIFKAFIGTSFLSFPFGFLQSGLMLGGVVLLLVVLITGHCCHLIVDIKKYVLRQRCSPSINADEDLTDDPTYKRLAQTIRFSDIGELCLGRYGPYLVDFFLLFTQTGFCVAYFIFLGNAIHDIIPPIAVIANDSATDITSYTNYMNFGVFHHTNISNAATEASVTTMLPAKNISDTVYVSVMPDLKYLVLCPLLPFILFAFTRDMRHMGPWSLLANLAIIAGYFTILSLMLIDFRPSPHVTWFNWKKVPVFFGQVTCAFEGIGLVLPVEASMRDNAHNFPTYINVTLAMVSCILASFGVLGYMRYGPTVAQVITLNIPSAGVVPLTLSCTLILAVTLTFPLQVFPVIEISERYLMGIGKEAMEIDETCSDSGDGISDVTDSDHVADEGSLIGSKTETSLQHIQKESMALYWKRNLLRTTIVIAIAGLAVLLRNNFAYVSALIGAMGSTALGYVLPCLFHLCLQRHELSRWLIAKDVLIIAFGVFGGIIGVVIVLQDIIASF